MRFALLFCLCLTPGFANTWTGLLVDSKCYAVRQRNYNPTDTIRYADRDMNEDIRYCAPSPKTEHFGLVQRDWTNLKFDPAGNAQAANLVRKTGKRPFLWVCVNGQRADKRTIKVSSMSAVDSQAPGHK